MAIRCVTALAVAAAVWLGGGTAVAGDDLPAGFIDGREHELRVRAVLGDVPPAPKKISRSATLASDAAVAACDPVQVAALRRVATTDRLGDDPAACVVVPEGTAAGADRLLLGPALLTGSDLDTVAARRVRKQRSEVILQLSPSGRRRWEAVAVLAGPTPLAVTADGRVVGRSTIGPDAGSVRTDPPHVAVLGSPRGLPDDDAEALVDLLRDTRSEAAIELARAAGMTEVARRIFGGSDPQVDDKEQLARDCPLFADEASLVFGCYDGRTVFVLRVDRPDLSTLMPVTAAHEMLHAVYEQMTKGQQRRVDRLVADYLAATPDARSHQLLTEYADLDEALRRNEAHSIVGTVEAELPRALERHYAKYFEDRADVAAQFQQYQHVFDELDATLTRLEGEAAALEAQLSSLEGEVNGANGEAERLFDEIESLRAQGRVEESNNLVDAQNAAVNRANSLVDQYNALVDQYNAKVAELDAAGLVGQQIYQSLTPIEA
jgi:hypothetical protein